MPRDDTAAWHRIPPPPPARPLPAWVVQECRPIRRRRGVLLHLLGSVVGAVAVVVVLLLFHFLLGA